MTVLLTVTDFLSAILESDPRTALKLTQGLRYELLEAFAPRRLSQNLISTQAMNEAQQRDQNFVSWLKKALDRLQWLIGDLSNEPRWPTLNITRPLLMLLTMHPSLLDSLQRVILALPNGAIHSVMVHGRFLSEPNPMDPPSDEALLATATRLAQIFNSLDSRKVLTLYEAPAPFASLFLTTLTRLVSVEFSRFPVDEATVRLLFANKKLRKLTLDHIVIPNESVDAFCLGIESSSLVSLRIEFSGSFSPDHEAHVATTLAGSKTLSEFVSIQGPSSSFYDGYCTELSNNFNSKLERLYLDKYTHCKLDLRDEQIEQGAVEGIDAAIVTKIRNLLKLNVQRKTCPPLFAAISNAETDVERKRCLVEAFDAVDIQVVFEYITANQNNLIELIQRLGRSRKRQRED